MPTVRVDERVYTRLKDLKRRLGHRSLSETIGYLLERAVSPRAFLESAVYFMEDVRRDVKELRDLLRLLVELLGSERLTR